MSTNIHIPKKCQFCGTIFIARTLTTKYCSHKCNSRHYKQLLKEKKVKASLEETERSIVPDTIVASFTAGPSLQKGEKTTKEFYSMKELASLLGVHERTIMNLVWKGKMPHCRIGRRIVIQKSEVLEIFKMGTG